MGYYLLKKEFTREGKPVKLLDQMALYVILGTVLGARMGHCLFYEPDYYLSRPLEMILPFKFDPFEFTGFRGLASHGGAIGILLALAFFVWRSKVPYLWVMDKLALVIPLSGAFIRMGNLMNSEIIGRPTDLPWAFVFESVDDQARHPSQLYEAISYVLIFFFIRYIHKNLPKRQDGWLFGWFLTLLFAARFFIELLKENQSAFEDDLTFNMGQLLSVPFVLVGLYLLYARNKKVANGS